MTYTDYGVKVRMLNDRLRQRGVGGRIVLSAGVAALSAREQLDLISAVKAFDTFTPDNDPYGEHDCAVIELASGGRFIWQIDYYDAALTGHSPDPSDEEATERMLSLMSADEY